MFEFSLHQFNRCVEVILQSLWTTAPVIGFDFAGSSGVSTPVEPTLFKPIRRINRCLFFSCCRLCLTGLTDESKFTYVGLTGEVYLAVFPACFRVYSRLFLGLFGVGVAPL